jgi:hypothetical protein
MHILNISTTAATGFLRTRSHPLPLTMPTMAPHIIPTGFLKGALPLGQLFWRKQGMFGFSQGGGSWGGSSFLGTIDYCSST